MADVAKRTYRREHQTDATGLAVEMTSDHCESHFHLSGQVGWEGYRIMARKGE